ncbi:MAG: pyridoxal-phosphate dependent enzyme [Anaerolineaceae bacterium]|nr:pyridoxal-phosphate dependent enzyme [Anaerolineaceae bacterium]
MARFECIQCGLAYPEGRLLTVCPNCGSLFTLKDLEYEPKLKSNSPGYWSYQDMLGIGDLPCTYLGEGQTPLVKREHAGQQFFAKLEGLNPSGSFKDRNSAITISFLRKRKIKEIVEDSSGNAGASIALYSAGFGIKSTIFIPEGTSGPKVDQIRRIGAHIREVPGERERAHRAVLDEINRRDVAYASHAMLPFGLAAYATIAFEIHEQLGGLPDRVFCPIGHGSLFLGVFMGFKAICETVKAQQMPKMIGVQPERCAPLYAEWNERNFKQSQFSSLAEGTMVSKPARGAEIIEKLKKDYDDILAIPEEDILPACHELAAMGIYVEPTSAMVFAALKKSPVTHDKTVLVFSGNGLKYS